MANLLPYKYVLAVSFIFQASKSEDRFVTSSQTHLKMDNNVMETTEYEFQEIQRHKQIVNTSVMSTQTHLKRNIGVTVTTASENQEIHHQNVLKYKDKHAGV